MTKSIEIVGHGFSIRNYTKTADVTMAVCATQVLIPCDYGIWADDFRGVDNQFTTKEFLEEVRKSNSITLLPYEDKRWRFSESYPLDEVLRNFGIDWLCGTPAYAVAWAILRGYKEIHCHGLDFVVAANTPDAQARRTQRRCLEMWLNYAKHRGIKVRLNAATFLFDHNREILPKLLKDSPEVLSEVQHYYSGVDDYFYGYQQGLPDLSFDLGYTSFNGGPESCEA